MLTPLIEELMKQENIIFGNPQDLGNQSFNGLMIQGKSSVYAFNGDINNKTDGFPTGAYAYGTIITLNPTHSTTNAYSTAQIYITDIPAGTHGIYIRTRMSGNWIKITGTTIAPVA